jgi:hypothetical protein
VQRAVSWAAKRGSTPRPAPILVRVQAHPSRRTTSLPRLLERLEGLTVEVMEHQADPANPWDGYRRCLEDTGGHDHVLVIQDDAIPCRNLVGALNLLARPVPVCLFLPNMPMRTRRYARNAIIAGERWVELQRTDWLPVVAVLWPTDKIRQFLRWFDAQPRRRRPDMSDDAVCGRWMRATGQKVLATLPSLVEHPDDQPSTWKSRRHPRHALWFIGDDVDPLGVEW